jgi:hypothetical protein
MCMLYCILPIEMVILMCFYMWNDRLHTCLIPIGYECEYGYSYGSSILPATFVLIFTLPVLNPTHCHPYPQMMNWWLRSFSKVKSLKSCFYSSHLKVDIRVHYCWDTKTPTSVPVLQEPREGSLIPMWKEHFLKPVICLVTNRTRLILLKKRYDKTNLIMILQLIPICLTPSGRVTIYTHYLTKYNFYFLLLTSRIILIMWLYCRKMGRLHNNYFYHVTQ